MGDKSGELIAELCGDGLGFGEDSVVELDGLVGVLVGARPREIMIDPPVLVGVTAGGTGGHGFPPYFLYIGIDG